MPLKWEVGGHALNIHGNYIVDHGKSWKNHGIVFLNFYGNPVLCYKYHSLMSLHKCCLCFHNVKMLYYVYCSLIWATTRYNLSSGFPTKRDSNQPAQLQRLV